MDPNRNNKLTPGPLCLKAAVVSLSLIPINTILNVLYMQKCISFQLSFVGKRQFVQEESAEESAEDSEDEWLPPAEKRQKMKEKHRKRLRVRPKAPSPKKLILEIPSDSDPDEQRTTDEDEAFESFMEKQAKKVHLIHNLCSDPNIV